MLTIAFRECHGSAYARKEVDCMMCLPWKSCSMLAWCTCVVNVSLYIVETNSYYLMIVIALYFYCLKHAAHLACETSFTWSFSNQLKSVEIIQLTVFFSTMAALLQYSFRQLFYSLTEPKVCVSAFIPNSSHSGSGSVLRSENLGAFSSEPPRIQTGLSVAKVAKADVTIRGCYLMHNALFIIIMSDVVANSAFANSFASCTYSIILQVQHSGFSSNSGMPKSQPNILFPLQKKQCRFGLHPLFVSGLAVFV